MDSGSQGLDLGSSAIAEIMMLENGSEDCCLIWLAIQLIAGNQPRFGGECLT